MAFDASVLPDVSGLTVAILGGTGDQGRGLAYRLARAGQPILIGSRSAQRAAQTAVELAGMLGVDGQIGGGENADVAARADITIIAVPWEGHRDTVAALREPLAGKLVVDCVNPLGFDKHGPYPLPVPEGSAAEQAAQLLPESRVCAAFHHVSATLLVDPTVDRIELDVLVLGEQRESVAQVQALAGRIPGVRGVYGGRLRNAHQVEAFTANIIAVNRRYKAHAGLRLTGV
jgi:hypothetical protein